MNIKKTYHNSDYTHKQRDIEKKTKMVANPLSNEEVHLNLLYCIQIQ